MFVIHIDWPIKMNLKETEITELIIRQLQGKTSAAEDKLLETWRMKDIANAGLIQTYQKIWAEAGNISTDFQPDVDSAWKKVSLRANLDTTTVRSIQSESRTVRNNGFVWAIAATFAILAGFGFLMFKTLNFNKIEYIEVLTQTESKEITLPDGSVVNLDKNSVLKYPEKFMRDERIVYLNGDAYFSIRKDEKKPFKVEGKYTLTEVLGTSFYIRSNQPEKELIEVYTGKVAYTSLKTKEKAILIPGQMAEVDYNGLLTQKTTHSFNSLSWKTNTLQFDDAPLKDIATDLERHFGKSIQLNGPIDNHRFTGTFNNASLEEVLNVVSISTDTEFSIRDSVYLLSVQSHP